MLKPHLHTKRDEEKSFNRLGSCSDLNFRGTLSSARLSQQKNRRSPSSSDSPLGLGTNTGSDGQQFSSPHHTISFVSVSNFPIWEGRGKKRTALTKQFLQPASSIGITIKDGMKSLLVLWFGNTSKDRAVHFHTRGVLDYATS